MFRMTCKSDLEFPNGMYRYFIYFDHPWMTIRNITNERWTVVAQSPVQCAAVCIDRSGCLSFLIWRNNFTQTNVTAPFLCNFFSYRGGTDFVPVSKPGSELCSVVWSLEVNDSLLYEYTYFSLAKIVLMLSSAVGIAPNVKQVDWLMGMCFIWNIFHYFKFYHDCIKQNQEEKKRWASAFRLNTPNFDYLRPTLGK